MSAMSWRSMVAMLCVSVFAIGWSVRPRPLDSADLYDVPPTSDALPVQSGHQTEAEYVPSPTSEESIQPRLSHTIGWGLLRTLNYVNGSMSDELRKLDGKLVRVPGFIVPLDDFQDEVTEFLLVPYFGACVHTPPPPPNQLVFVRISKGKQRVSLFEPVWIEGRLSIKNYQSIYGAVGFQMSADRITPYR